MPLVIIHTSSKEQTDLLVPVLEKLKVFVADKLTCNSRPLDPSEISVRINMSDASDSIGKIEVVVIAYSYDKRVENQDKICLSFKQFIEEHCVPHTVFVWLQLSELGHSA